MSPRTFCNWWIASAAFVSMPALATDGYFDPTWAGGGRLTFAADYATSANTSEVDRIIVMPGGNLMLFGLVSGDGDSWLGEMQPDGTWVAGFGLGDGAGRLALCYLQNCNSFNAAAIQAGSGNNVIIGTPYLVATDSTGTLLDNQYSTTGGINSSSGTVYALAAASLPNGKIVLAGNGYATADTSRPLFGAVRLNQDFTLDKSFNSATAGYTGGAVIEVFASDSIEIAKNVLVDASGRLILVGLGNGSAGTALEAVRLNADGTLDTAFGSGGVARVTWSEGTIDFVTRAVLDRAGRVVVALRGTTSAFHQEIMLAARLTESGALDAGFGPGAGFAQFSISKTCASIYAEAVAIDSAGRILVAGDCANSIADDFIVTRFRGDTGYLDASFGINGYSLGEFEAGGSGSALDIALDASGHPIVGGTSDSSGKAGIARLTYDLIHANDFEFVPRGCLPPDCN